MAAIQGLRQSVSSIISDRRSTTVLLSLSAHNYNGALFWGVDLQQTPHIQLPDIVHFVSAVQLQYTCIRCSRTGLNWSPRPIQPSRLGYCYHVKKTVASQDKRSTYSRSCFCHNSRLGISQNIHVYKNHRCLYVTFTLNTVNEASWIMFMSWYAIAYQPPLTFTQMDCVGRVSRVRKLWKLSNRWVWGQEGEDDVSL